MPGPIALQLEYSLVERSIEHEHVPAARECGLGITPWSPLAGGFLAGKYQRGDKSTAGEGRLSGSNPFQGAFTKFTERNWGVLDALRVVAAEADRPPSQVALAWASAQTGIASLILGARRLEQLHDNLASLDIRLTPDQLQTLDKSSAPGLPYPYSLFTPEVNPYLFGGETVLGWR